VSADIDNGGSIMTAPTYMRPHPMLLPIITMTRQLHAGTFRPLKAKNIVQNRGNINGERYS
jgi:hypothetical protein